MVLDFLWACLFVPRLWQGQDKSVSPRQESADMLRLTSDQVRQRPVVWCRWRTERVEACLLDTDEWPMDMVNAGLCLVVVDFLESE